jgi:hypothetical protein
MNWLPKDKAMWGIILAIAAIVLAFPLSLLANLVTPKIRNYWAKRSVAGLKKRIASLESELARMEGISLFSHDVALLLSFANLLAQCILSMMTCFLGIAVYLIQSLPIRFQLSVLGFIIPAALLGGGGLRLLAIIEKRYLDKKSPLHKRDLEKNIKELSAKLESLQAS